MNKKCIFIILLLLFISFPKVNASNICTQSKYNDLRTKAASIKAEWELVSENDEYYFIVTLSNVDKDLMIKFNQTYYEPENGTIRLDARLSGGETYNLQFYGGYNHSCVEEYIYTKKMSIPKYNKFSKMKECETYKDWELCDEWYSGVILDEEDFYYKLEQYKNKIASGEIKIEEKNVINPIVVCVAIVIVLGVAGYIGYVAKKKNKPKKKVKKAGMKNEKN